MTFGTESPPSSNLDPMDYDAYRREHFVEPAPEPRFQFAQGGGPTLWFADYDGALAYYTEVLGEPNYVEGDATRGWRIGSSWLTLFAGGDGHPRNVEIGIEMETAEDAERLQRAFVEAGGTGADPSDELMYAPIRYCPVTDPFGTELLVFAPLED
jgi:hypothetical protein